MKFTLRFSYCLLLGFLSTALAFGQVEAGSIAGTVRDAAGAVIAGAQVTAKSESTGAERVTPTGKSGEYNIPGLAPGFYNITISSGNFAPFQTRTEVTVGGAVTVDAQLTVGTSTTTVEVAGGATQVNTQTQDLSQLVDTQQLAALPSLTRNPYDFVVLSGNVSNGDNTTDAFNSGQNLTTRGVGYAINGQRESGTEILLDGVENISVFSQEVGQQIPVDSVQEYSIITNDFSAEYGRASGGIVNLTTKSGTNTFHGSAWEYNRLSAYTANTYQNDAQNNAFVTGGGTGPLPSPKGDYTRNQFGYLIGGPIKKDKLFVFESTEWTHVRSQANESELIPTPQFLAYTAPNVQSYFKAYGGNAYPISSTLNQSDLGVTLPGVPAGTPILGQVNFKTNADAGGDLPQNTFRLLGRLDYNLTDKTSMFFRIGKQSDDLFSGTTFYSPYPQYNVGSAFENLSTMYSLSHTFGPTLFNNTKLSYNRLDNPSTYDHAQQNVPDLMFQGGTANGLQITFPGLENYGEPGAGGLPFGGPQNTIQVEHDLSWTKGNHQMRFGGQFTYIQMNIAYGIYAQAFEVLGTGLQQGLSGMLPGINTGQCPQDPTMACLQYYEAAINAEGKLPCTQDAFGNLNENSSCEVTPPVGSPSFARSDRYKDWAIYAQDSFRATPRLTLNYGLRYEHYGVQHNNKQDLDSNFYYGPGSDIFEKVATGQVEIAPQSSIGQLWAPRWGTVAPRVGFAYSLSGDGRTSLRGGFGISYERNFGNVTFNTIENPPAFGVLQIFSTPVTNSNSGPLGTAGPPVPLPPLELRNVNQNINVAQTQFWSLALQRQVARNSLVELSYSGAHGVHLYDVTAGNPIGGAQAYLGAPLVSPTNTQTCTYSSIAADVCLTRNNDQYAAINIRGSGGSSAYEAVNVKFQTQNFHNSGLGLITNYTWSHALDDLSSAFSDSSQGGSGYIGNLGYLNPLNPMLDWGSSDYDVRNRVVVAPIWNLPWFKQGGGFLPAVAGGWSITGIVTARSGTPFSAYDFTYNVNSYSGVPRIVPATPITQYKAGAGQNVGPNQFQIINIPGANDLAPFSSTLGISDFGPFPSNMSGRNVFNGPGAWNTDASVTKTFNLTERVGLQFRAEGFDVFNHHNLYTNEAALSVSNTPGTIGPPLPVIALKGGLNSIAIGGNHDERRFGQFSLRASF
jgi:Carboxypeptidase regulatory-like domain/TonB dependent receptor